VLDSGRGLYYGLALHGDHLYVAARKRLVSSEQDPDQERGEILVFDRALRPCGSLQAPFPLRDLHGIAWHGGKLWATCSRDNLIAVYDGSAWEAWYPLGDSEAGDANHFNSFMFDDEHVWILAHNRGPSELMAFSLRTRERVRSVPLGNCGHNIWREDGQLFTCSSAESRLLGDAGFALDTGGFPRGVAFDAATRCIGVSTLSERKARDFNAGMLQVYSRDWRLRSEIDLPDEGLVLELLELPAGFAPAGPTLWSRLAGLLGGTPAAPAAVKSFPVRPA
jgi:hypothetical protein